MGIRILGTGSYLPEKTVSNEEIAKSLDTSDEWIYSHTGIHSRHVAGEGESTSTMAAAAAAEKLSKSVGFGAWMEGSAVICPSEAIRMAGTVLPSGRIRVSIFSTVPETEE